MADQERYATQQRFLDAFSRYGTVTRASQEVGIHRTTVNYWARTDIPFANSYAEAIVAYQDVIRDALHTRAVTGIATPVFHHGQPLIDTTTGKPLTVVKHSDALLALLARARLPEYKNLDAPVTMGVTLTEHSLIIEDIRLLTTNVLDTLLLDLERIDAEKATYGNNTIVDNGATPQSPTSQ